MLFTCVFSENPVGECPPVRELDRLRRENRILKDMLGDLEKEISRLRCEMNERAEKETDCHGASRLAMTGSGGTDCRVGLCPPRNDKEETDCRGASRSAMTEDGRENCVLSAC